MDYHTFNTHYSAQLDIKDHSCASEGSSIDVLPCGKEM